MKHNDLLKIAKTYGDPVYVYDSEKIIAQYNRLTNAVKGVKHPKKEWGTGEPNFLCVHCYPNQDHSQRQKRNFLQ